MKKILVTLIIMLVIVTPNFIISAKLSNSLLIRIKTTDLDEWHVIKDVPYVGQETGIDCELCSFTMLVHYLKKNYSLYDIFYLTGSGHALSYKPKSESKTINAKLMPPKLNPGSISSIWEEDWYLISDILGVNCNITYKEEKVDENTRQEAWEEYWNRVKTSINKDIPVYTHIDMSVLSYNKKHNIFPVGSGICHAIVIVGYNETNETICINDPGPAYDGHPEEGKYFYENFSFFKEAVEKSTKSPFVIYRYGYLTITLENKSESLPKKQAYEIVHFRNLGKMNGCKWAYDSIFLEDKNQLGINALKSYRKDMRLLKLIIKAPIWIIIGFSAKIKHPNSSAPFNTIPYFIKVIKDEKQFISIALSKISNCSFCKNEAHLFQNESQKWSELYDLYYQFVKIIDNKQYIKAMIKMMPIFYKMNKVIDEIIEIERMILKN